MELPVGRGLGLVLVAFCFLIILQDLQDDIPSTGPAAQKTAEAERNALDVISKGNYKDFDPQGSKWINITGLREDDGLSWHLLPQIQKIATAQTQAVLATEWIQTGSGNTHRLRFGELGERYKSLERLDALDPASTVIPFYQNVTGFVRGDWFRHELSKHELEETRRLNKTSNLFQSNDFARNITGPRGQVHLQLDERQSKSTQLRNSMARELKGQMTIKDASSKSWDIPLEGVHFVDSGSAILTTTSDRWAGKFALPFLVRSSGQFQLARDLLNQTIRQDLSKASNPLDPYVETWDSPDDAQDEMFPMPQCEYVVYLQQHFVWPYEFDDSAQLSDLAGKSNTFQGAPYLELLEAELRRPSGRTFDFLPTLRCSATIFSPDCGFVLESSGLPDQWYQKPGQHLKGEKSEMYQARIRKHMVAYAIVLFLQVLLLTRQIKDSSTPSTRSRISYHTIDIMNMADSYAVVASLFLSAFTRGTYLPLISVAFFLFLCVPFFGLKFQIDIWTIQAPEREERERQRAAARQASAPANPRQADPEPPAAGRIPTVVVTPAGADLLPLPVTARRPVDNDATQVILPPDQDIDAMIAEDELLHGPNTTANGNTPSRRFNFDLRFLTLSFCLAVSSYISSFWPSTVRSIYTNVVFFCYMSFWIPQIRRNMLRNCRKALRWEFVIGQSVLRLVPLGYCYVYENNVFFVKTDIHIFEFFAAWQWAQILLLLSQDVLGPRFFLPAGILPPAYDYHQVLREGDEEGGGFIPIGFSQDGSSPTGESKEKGKWTSDCIICMHTLEAPYVPRGGENQQVSSSAAAVTNIFARRDYMITPCRHIFHSQCLDGWMKYKLQCPICRESLPPL